MSGLSTHRTYGQLGLMVNNAGIGIGHEACELLLAHWDRVIDVSLRGVVRGVRAAWPVHDRATVRQIVTNRPRWPPAPRHRD